MRFVVRRGPITMRRHQYEKQSNCLPEGCAAILWCGVPGGIVVTLARAERSPRPHDELTRPPTEAASRFDISHQAKHIKDNYRNHSDTNGNREQQEVLAIVGRKRH